jgi:NAD(P)H-dependent FMN reductase
MSALNILVVAGSLNDRSATRSVTKIVAEEWRRQGATVDEVDLAKETLALFDPDSSYSGAVFLALKPRVDKADVIVLGTPDYHGTIASPLKNFLDHFWQEFAGKLFATIVASYDKGLTVTDHLRTVARQCYAWSMPYAMAFSDREDVINGVVKSEAFQKRLEMFIRDVRVYGQLIADQRRNDLAGSEPGFLARMRR